MLLKEHTSVIGCALIDGWVRAVQLKLGKRPGMIASRHALDDVSSATESNVDVSIAVATAIEGQRFAGRRVVTCLDSDHVCYRRMLLAPMPDAELGEAVRWQLGRDLKQSLEALAVDYYDVGETTEQGKPRRELLVVYSRLDVVRSHVTALEAAPLRPVAVDTVAGSLARCLAPVSKRTDAPARFIVHIGRGASVVVVARQSSPCFIHVIAHHATRQRGFAWTRERVEAFLPEISHEVNACWMYLSECGHGSMLPRTGCVIAPSELEGLVGDALREATGIQFVAPTTLMSPRVAAMMGTLPSSDDRSAWYVPIGLAMYGQEQQLGEEP